MSSSIEMGKTETIKERAIYVYLPSIEHADRWKELAKKHGSSISKFVIEHVENSLRQEENESYESRAQLRKRIGEFQEELSDVREDRRILRQLVDRQEKELRRYRSMPFLVDDFEGVRNYDRELIEILRKGGQLKDDEILMRLGIEPTESEATKAVSKQLEILQAYGLLRHTPRGWKWIG